MKKVLSFLLLWLNPFFPLSAQDTTNYPWLRWYEGRLTALGSDVVECRSETERDSCLHLFNATLDTVLQIEGSFFYPFDSVRNVSILTEPEKSFRILTWTFRFDSDSFVYFGCIQMCPAKGGELIQLQDSSHEYKKEPSYKNLTPENWYGALYYDLVPFKNKRQKYYVLVGWDGHNSTSSKKVLDVLWFDKRGEARFGAPVFKMYENRKAQNRVVWEFSNDAVMTLRYEPRKNIITFENLIPPDKKAKGIYKLYLPDGSYDYFRLKRGVWIKNEMLFDELKNATED